MFFAIFHTISQFSVVIPCIIGLVFFKLLGANSRLVLLLLVFASLSQLAPFFLKSREEIWAFYNTYIIIDVTFWGFIFFRNQISRMAKLFILLMMIIHVVISVNTFYNYGIKTRFYNELVCLDSLVQVLWVLIYFYELYKNEDIEKLELKPMFWFCLGILVYNPSTYFLFVYYNKIKISVTNEYTYLWRLHDLMNALMYILISIGLWVNCKKSTINAF